MGIARVVRNVVGLRRHHTLTAEALAAWRDARWRRLARRAVRLCPAYAERFRGLDLDRCALHELPVLRKDEVAERFDEFVTDRALRASDLRPWLEDPANVGRRWAGRYVPLLTSGTTGTRAMTVYRPAHLDRYFAAAAVRRLPRPARVRRRGRPRLAAILVTGGPYPTHVATRHLPRVAGGIAERRVFSLRDPLPKLVAALNAYQPGHVTSYPSVLGALAREQLAGRLRLGEASPLRSLHAVSEPLLPGTAALARRAFGLPVQDTYGAGESLLIARSCCAAGGLHEMSDLCIVEPVDEHGRPVPPGTVGEKILVTNLVNDLQPILRYEIGDRTGFAAEPCACGLPFPVLRPVAGRTHDVFWVDAPGGGYEPVHSTTLSSHVIDVAGVAEYQLVQTERNAFALRYVASGEDDPSALLRRVLGADLDRAGLGGRVTLSVERVAALERDPTSGKLRRIRSEVGPPSDLDMPRTGS